jgi:hypothetical protein
VVIREHASSNLLPEQQGIDFAGSLGILLAGRLPMVGRVIARVPSYAYPIVLNDS